MSTTFSLINQDLTPFTASIMLEGRLFPTFVSGSTVTGEWVSGSCLNPVSFSLKPNTYKVLASHGNADNDWFISIDANGNLTPTGSSTVLSGSTLVDFNYIVNSLGNVPDTSITITPLFHNTFYYSGSQYYLVTKNFQTYTVPSASFSMSLVSPAYYKGNIYAGSQNTPFTFFVSGSTLNIENAVVAPVSNVVPSPGPVNLTQYGYNIQQTNFLLSQITASAASFASSSLSSSYAQQSTNANTAQQSVSSSYANTSSLAQTASYLPNAVLSTNPIDPGDTTIWNNTNNSYVNVVSGGGIELSTDENNFPITIVTSDSYLELGYPENGMSMGLNTGNAGLTFTSTGTVSLLDNAGKGLTLNNGTATLTEPLTASVSSAVSSSYAHTASYASNVPATASFAVSSSYAQTASYANNVPATASFAISSSHALASNSASFATTASYASNVPATASFAVSASHANIASLAFTASALVPSGNYALAYLSASGDINVVGNLNVLNGAITYFQQYSNTYLSLTPIVEGNAPIIQFNNDNNQNWQMLANGQYNSAGSGVWMIYDNLSGKSPIEIFNPQITGTQVEAVVIGGSNGGTSDLLDETSTLQVLGDTNIEGDCIVGGTIQGTADNAISSAYATNANFSTSASIATTASHAVTSSYANTASFALNVTPVVSCSYASSSLSSSYAHTASYAPNLFPDITDNGSGSVGINNTNPQLALDVGDNGDGSLIGNSTGNNPSASIDLSNLQLNDNTPNVSIDYGERQLLYNSQVVLDWKNYLLKDSNVTADGVNSIDFANRQLFASTETEGATPIMTVDYQNRILSGSWVVSGSISGSVTTASFLNAGTTYANSDGMVNTNGGLELSVHGQNAFIVLGYDLPTTNSVQAVVVTNEFDELAVGIGQSSPQYTLDIDGNLGNSSNSSYLLNSSGPSYISSQLTVNGLTGSVHGTASIAHTASFAQTASFALNVTPVVSCSYASSSLSASYAITASATDGGLNYNMNSLTTVQGVTANGPSTIYYMSFSHDGAGPGGTGNTVMSMTPAFSNYGTIIVQGSDTGSWELVANSRNDFGGSGCWGLYDSNTGYTPIQAISKTVNTTLSNNVVVINGTNHGMTDRLDNSSVLQVRGNSIASGNVSGSGVIAQNLFQYPYSSSIQSLTPTVSTGSAYFQVNATTQFLYIYNGTRWCSSSLA